MGETLLLDDPFRHAVSWKPEAPLADLGSPERLGQDNTSLFLEDRARAERFQKLLAEWKTEIAFLSSFQEHSM
jgi:hypothetical protein